MTSVEFVDRYSGMGRRPSPLTSCKGGCEAVGLYPMRFEKWEERHLVEGDAPHICPQADLDGHLEPFPPTEEDAWVFVYCSTCGGTGRRVSGHLGRTLDKLYRVYYCAWFPFWAIRQTEGHGIRKLPWWFRFIWHETRYWG